LGTLRKLFLSSRACFALLGFAWLNLALLLTRDVAHCSLPAALSPCFFSR
jgi:hypothetical protein